ncbi:hypothetical protein HYDPIDRAFT_33889 [Hydnomerulius pinastri MD-312]|uniref:Uncharacterized protein n=1 Tax=Hydnomerulius pinastri MD-312 TaxID=994086 RepID=A0A0C9V0J1_9AGAM|nr:hypothetical protein HYDPIDRAFT_33889 [Hydnomerulius pinastri MD-312]
MAVLAPADWHPPRDHTMDAPSNSAIPRQRSSPANDHPSSTHPQQSLQQQHSQQSQQPYPYPVQQQQAQGAWTPSVSAQPFYPSFYQNQQHPPQPYPIHPHQPQNPYFDPTANAQLAQWAYQQMMFNAQAQAQMGPHSPITGTPQRSAPSSAPASPAEYFNPNQLFNHFPSGTPPPQQQSQHHSHHAPSYTQRTASADTGRTQYDGFHPYRRPQNTASGASGRSQGQEGDWRPAGTFQPPYARGDASASSTSVNSSNSNHGNGSGGNGGSRQRTSSIQGQSPSHSHPHVNGSASHQGSVRSRSGSSPQQRFV